MLKKLGLSVFFGLIFVSSLVLAQDFDVSVDITPIEESINLCDVTIYDITIKNTGRMKDIYEIEVKGLPERWYSLSHESVELVTGEEETIYLFVTASCDDGQGVYHGSVSATGESEDLVNFKLTVSADRGAKITLPDEVASCLCEGGFVKAKIENTGNQREELVFSLTSEIAKYLELEKTSMILGPGETKTLDITISDECKPEGEYSLELSADAKRSYVTAKAETEIELTKCYEFKTTMPGKLTGCEDEDVFFDINVKNIGLKSDEYVITIDELNYSKTVKLDPKDSEDLRVSFEKDVGEYTLEINVESDSQQETYEVEINIEKCYDADLVIEKDSYETMPCQGKLVKGFVENKGTKSDTYNIISDKEWVIIKPKTVELDPEETQDVSIYCSPAYDMDGEYNIKVTASSEKVFIIKSFILNVLGEEITETTTTVAEEGTTTTMECKFYYWFDDEHKTCGYKEFCGLYMYEGLRTFDTLEECIAALQAGEGTTIPVIIPNETTTTRWALPNVTITLPFEDKIPGIKLLKPLIIALLIAFIVLGGLYWLVMKGE